jgi:hypothetical protein
MCSLFCVICQYVERASVASALTLTSVASLVSISAFKLAEPVTLCDSECPRVAAVELQAITEVDRDRKMVDSKGIN